MEIENIITIYGDTQEDIIKWSSTKIVKANILETLFYITNNYRKKYCNNIILKDNLSNEYTEEKAILLKNPNLNVVILQNDLASSTSTKDFKNVYNLLGEEQNVVIEKFKKGKKTENVTMDFATISKINQNFEETYLKFMNKTQNAAANENTDLIEFQTKGNFKVAGNDGKSQFNFMQIADKKQIDLSIVSQKGYTVEEVLEHNNEDSTWMIVNEKIYDITIYKRYHPGGVAKIMMGAGKDATSLVFKYHPWVNVHNILEKYQVGFVTKKK